MKNSLAEKDWPRLHILCGQISAAGFLLPVTVCVFDVRWRGRLWPRRSQPLHVCVRYRRTRREDICARVHSKKDVLRRIPVIPGLLAAAEGIFFLYCIQLTLRLESLPSWSAAGNLGGLRQKCLCLLWDHSKTVSSLKITIFVIIYSTNHYFPFPFWSLVLLYETSDICFLAWERIRATFWL